MGDSKSDHLSDGHETEDDESEPEGSTEKVSQQPAGQPGSLPGIQDVLVRHYSKTGGLKTPAPSTLSRHRAYLETRGRLAAHNGALLVSDILFAKLLRLPTRRFLRRIQSVNPTQSLPGKMKSSHLAKSDNEV